VAYFIKFVQHLLLPCTNKKMKNYKIEMGNYLEDYSIFYNESDGRGVKRELKIDVDIINSSVFNLFSKGRVTIYLDSFTAWNSLQVLTLYEYSIVIKRVYNYLRKKRYEIRFE